MKEEILKIMWNATKSTYPAGSSEHKAAILEGDIEAVADEIMKLIVAINPTTINPNSKGEKKKKVDLEIQLAFSSENFKNAWADFTEHRKQLKKPLTERSAKLQMQTLQGMGEARAIAAIKHSVANGWQGIFEPKGESGTGNSEESQG